MIHVNSEIGTLRRLVIHSPDDGLGKVIPSKAQDWLFEDIVHLETVRRKEYDYYVKLLLYFLDTDKVKGKLAEIDAPEKRRGFYIPSNPLFHNSDKVLDIQKLMIDILGNQDLCFEIVAAIGAIEGLSYAKRQMLRTLNPIELASTLISGVLPDGHMIFAPVPNFIFTRDIGITINNFILLNKPAKQARSREAFLAHAVFFHHPIFKENRQNVIEISDDEHFFLLEGTERENAITTLEGGDIMMVAPNNLLVGVSERTTPHAVNKIIEKLFERDAVDKVSVIKIPPKRDFMHIDTVFTQVKRNVWVLYDKFSKKRQNHNLLQALYKKTVEEEVTILQFQKGMPQPIEFEDLEALLDNVSQVDLKASEPTQFIYSGGGEFPYSQREQWTDSCNLLAIKEGVVLGYDRNDVTAKAFEAKGFEVIGAQELLQKFENEDITPESVSDTLILLPSAELSRARGGWHCMSMPILRDSIF